MTDVLFQTLHLGNEKNGQETADLVQPLLIKGETVILSTKGIRDGAVITNIRIIVVNRQGITGKKIEFSTIPFKSITAFTIENAGTFDIDAELTVYGSGFGKAKMQFTRGFPIAKLGALITAAVL